MYVTRVHFNVLRVRVPKGIFSESGNIWNHLEEEVITAQTAQLLHRNGLRVARGKLDAWRPIKALLDAVSQAQTSDSAITMNNGLPLLLELHTEPRDQTMFLYRPDGTLAGAPFPASTNLLRIEYQIPLDDPDALEVNVMPEVQLRHARPRSTISRHSPLGQVLAYPTRVLRELAFRLVLRQGEFLAIGPTPAAHEIPYLPGSLLLCDELDGRRYESMFFITPHVSRAGPADGS